MKKKVSFDFDSTLDRKIVQIYAKELLSREDVEVWVVTSRFGDNELFQKFFMTSHNVEVSNKDLWKVINTLEIPKERVIFTNMKDKYHFFKNKNFLWHLDDDFIEVRQILNNTKTIAINCWDNPNWKHKCERFLKRGLLKSSFFMINI